MTNSIVYGAGMGYTRADFEEIVLIQYIEQIPKSIYSVQFKNFRFHNEQSPYDYYTVYLRDITDCITYKNKYYHFIDLPNLSLRIEQEKLDDALNVL